MSKIAIIGRPNTGKSTLFNLLSDKKKAVVFDRAGVTRDSKYADGSLFGLKFTIIDTPGLDEAAKNTIERDMTSIATRAIEDANIVLFVVDNTSGIVDADREFSRILHKSGKKVLLIANKCEKDFSEDSTYWKLGHGVPLAISALHRVGVEDLYKALKKIVQPLSAKDKEKPGNKIRLMLAGKPNSGKSTIINNILRADRMLTKDMPGTTRESTEIDFYFKSQDFVLIDSAGVRRKPKIEDELEKISASDALRSIKFANIVAIVMDATIALQKQDIKLANFALKEGRAVLFVVNKWDLVEDKHEYKKSFPKILAQQLPGLGAADILYISALKSGSCDIILKRALDLHDRWRAKISTGQLNAWLGDVTERMKPANDNLNRPVKLKYAAQIHTGPPYFKIFVNKPDALSESYKKYLLNSLHKSFDFAGVQPRIEYTSTNNPYDKKKKQ